MISKNDFKKVIAGLEAERQLQNDLNSLASNNNLEPLNPLVPNDYLMAFDTLLFVALDENVWMFESVLEYVYANQSKSIVSGGSTSSDELYDWLIETDKLHSG